MDGGERRCEPSGCTRGVGRLEVVREVSGAAGDECHRDRGDDARAETSTCAIAWRESAAAATRIAGRKRGGVRAVPRRNMSRGPPSGEAPTFQRADRTAPGDRHRQVGERERQQVARRQQRHDRHRDTRDDTTGINSGATDPSSRPGRDGIPRPGRPTDARRLSRPRRATAVIDRTRMHLEDRLRQPSRSPNKVPPWPPSGRHPPALSLQECGEWHLGHRRRALSF